MAVPGPSRMCRLLRFWPTADQAWPPGRLAEYCSFPPPSLQISPAVACGRRAWLRRRQPEQAKVIMVQSWFALEAVLLGFAASPSAAA
eukprot:COSAG01_NODE_7342_length_3242_cov_21.565383_4_plen_87_part_01